MKKTLTLLAALCISATGFSQSAKKVLLIGIDGCRPDAQQVANTPNLDALRDNGTYSYDVMNDGITISGPGWGSLLTGVWPDKHGVTDNTFVGFDFVNYPHLFRKIEEYDSDLNTVSVCQWSPINLFLAPFSVDETVNVQDHSTYVEAEAIDQLTNGDPDAIFLHFDDVDHAGHNSGFSPNNQDYLTAIETVDASIGGIMTALTSRPTYANEDWAIVVSTDHGGVGTSHGGTSFEHRNIFLFVSGDNIPNVEIVADSIETATPPVTNCLGDSVQLYFDGNSRVNTWTPSVFNFGTNQDFSVECRVRTTNAADVAIVTNKDWNSGNNPGWVFSFGGNGEPWKVNIGDGNDRVDVNGGNIADGEWHTLSATFDRDGNLTIYEDGVEAGSSSLAAIDDISTIYPVLFGADGNNAFGFEGNIAEVRLFDTVLSGVDINAWKCTSVTNAHPNYANLIGYWRLIEGGSSTEVLDASPSQVNGTITNAEWQSAIDTIYSYEKDYSTSPKQVDYVVSALEHLCIPINPDWDLDGNVVGTSCSNTPSGVEEAEVAIVSIYIDEHSDQVTLVSQMQGKLSVYDMSGRAVYIQQPFNKGTHRVSVGQLPSGVYLFKAEMEDSRIVTKKITIH